VLDAPNTIRSKSLPPCLMPHLTPLHLPPPPPQNLLDGLLAELKSGGPGGYEVPLMAYLAS
jgi:hypothetical protein